MSEWTDEVKAEVIAKYTAGEPTPVNTMDIVSELAEEYGFTVNGVRMILSTAKVYVAKGKKAATSPDGADKKPARKSKQDSIDELTAIMADQDIEIDDSIVSKMTGKAADYWAAALKQIIED